MSKQVTHTFKDGSILTVEKTDQTIIREGEIVLVTDPCYWFDKQIKGEDLWGVFCDLIFPPDWSSQPDDEKLWTYAKVTLEMPSTQNKVEFLFTSTKDGDGYYGASADIMKAEILSSTSSFSVDAGCYAIVNIYQANLFLKEDEQINLDTIRDSNLGAIFKALTDFKVYVDGANMRGGIRVTT